ncbi:MAG: chorismate synthase [Eubacterium sp.]|nr:chorismate synthase [Eubacterium sp.]
MSIFKGDNISIDIFGESHGNAIGVVINGLPAGEHINNTELMEFLDRRAPGRNAFSTSRNESDAPNFLSGIMNGLTGGTPVCAIIYNSDQHSTDYESIKNIPRPGHADYSAHVKFSGVADMRGGGHFSGRLTAPLCIAGGIAKQILKSRGITVVSHISSIAGINDKKFADSEFNADLATIENLNVIDSSVAEQMKECILSAKADGDSVGGTVECMITGLPAGLGGLIFDGVESRISAMIFGIPAIKGIEFGNGFAASELPGSKNNDAFCVEGSRIFTALNNHGGLLGGITTGMPIVFRVAVKPTPSIAKTQNTVDLNTGGEIKINIKGRHDPCIVPRALPCVESVAALVALDLVL